MSKSEEPNAGHEKKLPTKTYGILDRVLDSVIQKGEPKVGDNGEYCVIRKPGCFCAVNQ